MVENEILFKYSSTNYKELKDWRLGEFGIS